MVRIISLVSELPLGLGQVVRICSMPRIEQFNINFCEVGWQPLSWIRNSLFSFIVFANVKQRDSDTHSIHSSYTPD